MSKPNNFVVTAKIKHIYPMDKVGKDGQYSKVDFLLDLTEKPEWPCLPKFELFGDRCDQIANFKAGDEVIVNFNLGGRPFVKDGKQVVYTKVEAWRIQPASAAVQETASAPVTDGIGGVDMENLPF